MGTKGMDIESGICYLPLDSTQPREVSQYLCLFHGCDVTGRRRVTRASERASQTIQQRPLYVFRFVFDFCFWESVERSKRVKGHRSMLAGEGRARTASPPPSISGARLGLVATFRRSYTYHPRTSSRYSVHSREGGPRKLGGSLRSEARRRKLPYLTFRQSPPRRRTGLGLTGLPFFFSSKQTLVATGVGVERQRHRERERKSLL